MPPTVSICIPTYEAPISLVRLLDSILMQSFQDFEIIISDDSRDDSIARLLHSFPDQRIRYYHNPIPLGSPENWNHAVHLAIGDYIKIMHHDDWFNSRLSLERMISVMKEKDADMLFVQSKNILTKNYCRPKLTNTEFKMELI